MPKCIVITRQLFQDKPPVVMKVIGVPKQVEDDPDWCDEGYLKSKATEAIQEFVKKFVEFTDASFVTHILELD